MANALLLVALLVVGCAALASATTYTVGDSQGWTTAGDYNSWASGKSFVVGDKLGELPLLCSSFTYSTSHSIKRETATASGN